MMRCKKAAYSSPELHLSLWKQVAPLISRAHLSYANHEGPEAEGVALGGRAASDPGLKLDGLVYTGSPPFNYNPTLSQSLVKTGFDVVSTANNHAMDRKSLGIDRTLAALDDSGIHHSGTLSSQSLTNPFYTITDANGFRIAWLACSYGNNLTGDSQHQVLLCTADKPLVLSIVRALAQRSDIDAVIVTPHWGIDWALSPSHRPTAGQQLLAHQLLEAGATAVLGNHPHVVQPWEKYVTADGRETFVIYCIGNFVTGQQVLDERASMILYLGLTRTSNGRVTINGVSYVPTYMLRSPKPTVVAADTTTEGADAYKLVTQILGPWNALASSSRLITNQECQ